MASEGAKRKQSLVAAGDYRDETHQGKIVHIDTAAPEQAVLVSVLGGRGDAVMMNHPGQGQPCELVEAGFAKARCGAAIPSAGIELTPDADGRLVPAASGHFVFAISRTVTAAVGEWVGIKITGPYVKA